MNAVELTTQAVSARLITEEVELLILFWKKKFAHFFTTVKNVGFYFLFLVYTFLTVSLHAIFVLFCLSKKLFSVVTVY